jgi:hypothetical protein
MPGTATPVSSDGLVKSLLDPFWSVIFDAKSERAFYVTYEPLVESQSPLVLSKQD